MGLDITAYRQVTKLDAVSDACGEPIDPQTREPMDYGLRVNVNYDFPSHAVGLEDKAVYSAKDSVRFRAGSYSGYNSWREELARLAGYPAKPVDQYGTGQVRMRHDAGAWDVEAGPFHGLIQFSDCEGTIGSAVSAKLAADFAEFDTRAKAHAAPSGDWFYELYQNWRLAFELAADGGAVDFH